MSAVRVVVVDDSPTMRAVIAGVLRRDPEVEVVAEAADPFEAREAIKAQNPDVVTLDVEMPNMNGLDFLERLMRLRPMPVVMVSSQTQAGTEATLHALELGAVDCVAKPACVARDPFPDLAQRVKAAARARVRPGGRRAAGPIPQPYVAERRLIAIGSSTGGVEALSVILADWPANAPPTVIAQHMPANFIRSFAARLDRACGATVREATDGAFLESGTVVIAPGTHHLEVVGNERWRCRLSETPPVGGHRPSVDVLFRSVAKAIGSRAVGVILTGMGRDGAEGLLAMRRAGARTLAQDEASSVVYGMPRVAHEIGAAERRRPLDTIRQDILELCRKPARETA